MKKPIYLDYTAATPMLPEVLQAMLPYLKEDFFNPSSPYLAGKATRIHLEKARADVANVLGAKTSEIIFTAGSTEANNIAIQGVMNQFPGSEVAISAIEHDSVRSPVMRYRHKFIPVDKYGIVKLEALAKIIKPDTVLVCVMLINHELGTIQPLPKIATFLQQIRNDRNKKGNKTPVYLYTDAAQAAGYRDLHVNRLGVDLLSINSAKIYGPKQVGALYIKSGIELKPLFTGGGQEFGLRSGTENVAGAIGLAKALGVAQSNRQTENQRITKLRESFVKQIKNGWPDVVVNGSDKHQSPAILNITLPGTDNERLMMQLDESGIQVAVGSACAAAAMEASPVLKAIGLSDETARSSLRFSFGRMTTEDEINETVKILLRILNSNR